VPSPVSPLPFPKPPSSWSCSEYRRPADRSAGRRCHRFPGFRPGRAWTPLAPLFPRWPSTSGRVMSRRKRSQHSETRPKLLSATSHRRLLSGSILASGSSYRGICPLMRAALGSLWREYLCSEVDRNHFLGQLYGGLLYLRVGRLQMEEELDDEALRIFAFEVTTTPTIQLVHGFPYVHDNFTTKLLL
jgi:hypothetical protein